MSLIVWIVLFCLLGGLLSVLAAALFLVLRESLRNQLLPHLVSFATGTLLGAAFLGLLFADHRIGIRRQVEHTVRLFLTQQVPELLGV